MMGKFRITAPDGKQYDVTAPDGASEQDVLAYVQKNLGQQEAPQQGITPPPVSPRQAEDESMAAYEASKNTLPDQKNIRRVGLTDMALQGVFGIGDEVGAAGAATGAGLKSATSDIANMQMPALDRIKQAASDAYERRLAELRLGTEKYRAENPVKAATAELLGGMATGGQLQKSGLTLLNAAKPTYPSMIGRGALEGAAYGGAYGFGQGEGGFDERVNNAAKSAALGAVTGGTMGAVGAKMASNAAKSTVPTSQQLKAQADPLYKAADDAGLVIAKDSWKNFASKLQGRMADEGIDATIHGNALAALKRVTSLDENVTLKGAETIRRVINDVAGSPDPSTARMAQIMKKELDGYLSSLGKSDVLTKDALRAPQLLGEARKLWARASKAETIETAIELAGSRAGQFSGSGYENALRTEFRALERDFIKHGNRGFTDAEVAAIRKVARGGPIENALRYFGKLAPTGVVSAGSGAGLGYMVGGPVGAVAVPAAAIPARLGARAMTSNNANSAALLARAGGQLPSVQMLPAQQRALLGALMASGALEGSKVPGLLNMYQ